MGLADFFLYGGSSGGGGGGSSLPSNWDVKNNSLTIKGEGLNSLGWRCSNKDYYFEKNFSWTVVDEEDDQNFRTYDKINDTPGLIILFRFGSSTKSYCLGISTDAGGAQIKDRNNDNAVRGSFEYLNHTWYYCRTNPGTDFGICDDLELITLSGVNDGDVEAAKLAIDYAGISFEASNDFTQLASPDKDYTIAAGGSASDFSDATFRVNSSGDVFGGNFYSNGVAISSAFTGATSSSAGAPGIVPAPSSADINKFLKGDGSWAEVDNWSTPSLDYSMDEQDTGIFWTSQYRIFRKTIQFNAGGQNSVGTIKYDITSLMEDVSELVNVYFHSTIAGGPGGTFFSDFRDISRIYKVVEDDTPKWYYYANPGGSDIWYRWLVTVTIEYTKGPVESEIIPITSNATGSVGFYNYIFSNWQTPREVFKTSGLTNRVNQSLYGANGLGIWTSDQDGNAGEPRIDGADWISCYLGGEYIPYCLRFYPNVNNNWLGTSTFYLDFSKDNVHWDTLREPYAPTGSSTSEIRLPVLTNDKYSYVRVRFLGGTNAGGYANIGCIAGIQVYGI